MKEKERRERSMERSFVNIDGIFVCHGGDFCGSIRIVFDGKSSSEERREEMDGPII